MTIYVSLIEVGVPRQRACIDLNDAVAHPHAIGGELLGERRWCAASRAVD